MDQCLIAHKDGGHRRIDGLVHSHICSHIVGHSPCRTGRLTLYLHRFLESLFIYRDAFLLQNLLCQIKRKSVGIIELERMIAGQYGLALFFHFTFHLRKDTKSLVDSLRELLLFLSEHFKDEILSLLKLRITVL